MLGTVAERRSWRKRTPVCVCFSRFTSAFMCFWLRWVFVAAWRLLQLPQAGAALQLRCRDFSLQWFLLRSTCSRIGLSGCLAETSFLCDVWNLPRPGIEPVSPACAGRFLTSGPPGKSQCPDSFKKVKALSECEKCRLAVENVRKRDNAILLTQHIELAGDFLV